MPPKKKQRVDGEPEDAEMDPASPKAEATPDVADPSVENPAETPKAGGGAAAKAALRPTAAAKFAAKGGGQAGSEAVGKEVEQDQADDDREKLSESIGFNVPDTTLNVMVAATGGLVMTVNEGGLCHLLAGARANVGIRSGRYMFEARVVEATNQVEPPGQQQRSSLPRNLVRIGFSTAGSVPLIGDTEESVCFDSEGSFQFNKKKTHVGQKFGLDCVVGVLLNMNESGPGAMTMSIFKDGVRVAEPQPLPEVFKGKTLYPTVTFKNVSLQLNFGPQPSKPLPFRCRMLQEAAKADIEVASAKEPDDGKYNVLFPVCLPDAGTFHWCDWFLSQNPQYTEISDRKIIDWAVRSGVWRPKTPAGRLCNDRPDMNLGIASLEDGSAKKTLLSIAAVQRRHVVIMEVRGNLTQADRGVSLKPFRLQHFKRIAWVMAGEPQGDYRDYCFSLALKDKQEKSNAEFASKKAERERKRYLEKRQKEVEKAKRKMERKKQRMLEEQQRREQAGGDEKKEGDGPPSDEKKDGELPPGLEQKEDDDSEEEDEPMKEEPEEEAPKVELTEDERSQCFKKKEGDIPDISSAAMMTGAGNNWSFPGKEEGFDDVEFLWQDPTGSEYAMKQWKNERKLTTKIEYIAPSEWFKEKWKHWQGDLQRWHVKHMEFKDPVKRQARKEALQLEKLQKQQAAMQEQQAKNENGADSKVEGEPAKDENTEEKKDGAPDASKENKQENSEENKPDKDSKAEEGEQRDPMVELEEQLAEKEKFDVFGIEEILDSNGEGEPLFSQFAFEDWALLSLRFELHLVVHAFRRDCKDPDRTGFPPDHLPFYYHKYFRKNLNPRNYGAENVDELIDLIGDTLVVCDKTLESQITDDLETNEVFVKLAEEERRDRLRRIEAGDPKAPLKFSRAPPSDMVMAQAQMKAPPAKIGMPAMLGMGAVPKGAGGAPFNDAALASMSKAGSVASMELALPGSQMPTPMDGGMGGMDPNASFEAAMWGKGDATGMGMDASGSCSGMGTGDWSMGDGSASGGGWDANGSGDWSSGYGYEGYDKGQGKGKMKAKMAMMIKGKKGKGGAGGGDSWYGGGGDKGGWGKSPKGGGKASAKGASSGGWKGGW